MEQRAPRPPDPRSAAGGQGRRSTPAPSTGAQPTDRSYPTGAQPTDRWHPTGSQPADRLHATGPHPADRLYPPGAQPADRSYTTGPHRLDSSYSTGSHSLDRSYPTGAQPDDRPSPTGRQPSDLPRSTGRRSIDRQYATGAHPAVRPNSTGAQPGEEWFGAGPQPTSAGPQQTDRSYGTGPQPIERPRSTERPVDHGYITGSQAFDRRYSTGPQPVDPRYSTGQQPAIQPVDPRYSTGQQPAIQPIDRRYPTGQQPAIQPIDQRYPTGQQPAIQPIDQRYPTGQQPAVQPFDGSAQAAWAAAAAPANERSYYSTAPAYGEHYDGPAEAPRYDEQQYGDQQRYGDHGYGGQQYGGQQYEDQQHGEQRCGEQQHSDQPYGEPASDDRDYEQYLYEEQRYADEAWQREHAPGWQAEPDAGGYPGYADEPGVVRESPAQTRLRSKKALQRRRTKIVGRTSAAVLAGAVLLATGFTWGTKKWSEAEFRQVAALDLASPAIVDAAKQRGDDNFLLIGLDSRPGADAEDPTGGARSDTAMVVHIPQDRSRVVVLSFPRDLLVERPACEAWDQTAGRYTGMREQAPTKDRISTAYRYGGPRCATRAVQQVSGLAINHFVGMEFAGFKAMVDAVGGVQVCVDRPIKDDVLGEVVPTPGQAQLDGDRALAFVRAGHVAGDDGDDTARIRRQQELLAALARNAASARTLADPGRMDRLVDAMAANTFVDNVDAGQLTGLAGSLAGLDAGKVTLVTVPTAPTGDHRELRPEDATALFRAVIGKAPLGAESSGKPGGAPPPPSGELVPSVPPDQIKLQVVNGTGEEGLATKVAKRLRSAGFGVVTMDNAPQPSDRTVIRYAPAREQQAMSVAAAVPRAALQPDQSMGGAIAVLLGSDFDGAVQAVQLGQPLAPRAAADPAPAGGDTTARLDAVSAATTACT